MIASSDLMRIFWPSDTSRSTSSGVIIGWKNSDLDIFVLAVLHDVEVRVQHPVITQPS